VNPSNATTPVPVGEAQATPPSEPSVARLADRIRAAAADRCPLAIVGGGSKAFLGGLPVGETLSTAELAGIVSYEPSELVVTARAGTPLSELEAALAERGQCLPFEPPHFDADRAGGGRATVGGMVAAGLAGPARASVGGVRDYVLGAALLDGQGRHLVFGGQVMKNVAGYDISRALVGSFGILGLITEVSLKVLPVAPAEATLRLTLDAPQALTALAQWRARPLPLNASCWVRDGSDMHLYLRLRGAAAAVEAACRELADRHGAQRLDTAATAADWTALREQTLPWFAARDPQQALWHLSLPATAPATDLPEPPLMEWHGARRWVRAPLDQGPRLASLARRAGGSATLFRAPTVEPVRRPIALDDEPPAFAAIVRRLKAVFDPAGILNPGRLYAGL